MICVEKNILVALYVFIYDIKKLSVDGKVCILQYHVENVFCIQAAVPSCYQA